MPKVSVLMSVYNCENTVKKSIDSIVEQTFTDWELIICDDGSKDNTYKLVQEIAKEEPRIVLIKNDRNRGLSYSLNHCLKVAKGSYCARMDGDDLCDSRRFEKQVEFLDNNKEYAFVSTRMTRFDEHGTYQVPKSMESYSPTIKDFVKGSPFCHAPVMVRKSAYDAVSGYRDIPQTLGVEDYDLWFRLYAKGYKGYILQESLYHMFDGRGAAKRRTCRRRLNEAWVRRSGYRMLKIPIIFRVYIFKPILIGMIPQHIYRTILRR